MPQTRATSSTNHAVANAIMVVPRFAGGPPIHPPGPVDVASVPVAFEPFDRGGLPGDCGAGDPVSLGASLKGAWAN